MQNEKFVRHYRKKARNATRSSTREMYHGLALLGERYPQAELERQLREELQNVEQKKALKPDFCRVCQRLLRQALKDLRQEDANG